MMVCSIEIWGDADGMTRRKLGEVRIARAGGDKHFGHYDVVLMKDEARARDAGPWRKGHIRNFRRQSHGPYDLLLRGLVACIAGRNVADARSLPDDTLLFAPPASEQEAA